METMTNKTTIKEIIMTTMKKGSNIGDRENAPKAMAMGKEEHQTGKQG